MKVKVLETFCDKVEKKVRIKGETFELSEERYENIIKTNKSLIVECSEECDEAGENPLTKHVGGGWYELSNGEKVKGKEEAEALEAELRS